MPRHRRASNTGGDDDETYREKSFEGQLTSVLEAFTRAQAESNRQLLETLMLATPHIASSPSPSTIAASGNFAGCTARFNGTSRDPEVVEAFIDSIQIYKECTNVTDEHALKGFPMLLEGEAAVWFRGVKGAICS